MRRQDWRLAAIEAGLAGELLKRLALDPERFAGGEVLATVPAPEELALLTDEYRRQHGAQVGLGASLLPGAEQQDIQIVLITPLKTQSFARPYGGPPGYAPRYAVNHSLDLLRHI